MKKNKINSALVNFGGDIYAHGLKPDGEMFKVGIKNPKNPQEKQTEVEIKDQALTTSASYERNYKVEDKTFSHILSKNKEASTTHSVTVVSKRCLESGVYSTALMIDPSIETKNQVIIL